MDEPADGHNRQDRHGDGHGVAHRDGHGQEGYNGPATVVVDERAFAVDVELRGHFQPIDGRYHWYGRLRRNDELSELLGGRKHAVHLRTPSGEAMGELSDPDPWDRYRIMGASTPPFAVPTTLAEADAG